MNLVAKPPVSGSKGDIAVTVDVTNTGSREGDEVAQLYVREEVSSVETPSRSLKGFARIHLKPQETKTVTFHLSREQFAVWNMDEKWAVETGYYTLWAGGSSKASLTTRFFLNP